MGCQGKSFTQRLAQERSEGRRCWIGGRHQHAPRDQHLHLHRLAGEGVRGIGVHRRPRNLDETISTALSGRTKIVVSSRDEEGCERCLDCCGTLWVKEPVYRHHPVKQRCEPQVAAVELPFALTERSVGVDGVLQRATGGTEASDVDERRQIGERCGRLSDDISREPAHRALDSGEVIDADPPFAELDHCGREQISPWLSPP